MTTNASKQVSQSEKVLFWISRAPQWPLTFSFWNSVIITFSGNCQDVFKSKCKYFSTHHGYCTHWTSFMKKYCPQSCGFCKTAAPGEMACNVWAPSPRRGYSTTFYTSKLHPVVQFLPLLVCHFRISLINSAPIVPANKEFRLLSWIYFLLVQEFMHAGILGAWTYGP